MKPAKNSLCLQEEACLAPCLQPPAKTDSARTLDLPHVWGRSRFGSAATEPGTFVCALCDITEGRAGTEWDAKRFEFRLVE